MRINKEKLLSKSSYGQAVKILFIFDNLAKLLNFAKNIIITAALGFSKIPDAFNLSRSINGTFYNTINNALLAGTLPYLNEKEDIQEKINFLYSLVILILGFFTILSFFIILYFDGIIDLLAPGFEDGQKELVYIFFLLQLPLSFITVFTKAFESYFRSEQIFGISNIINFLTAVIAFVLMLLFVKSNYYFLAIGPLVGTVVGFVYFLTLIPKKMTSFDKNVFSIIKFAIPLVLGGSFTIINSFVDKGFSSTLPSGHLTTLDLANGLQTQIKALIAGPIVGALYAFISISISNREYISVQDRINKVSKSLIGLFSIIFIGYLIFGRWGLSVIFEHGIVDADNIELLYLTTLIMLPLTFNFHNITSLVLFSFKNAKLPTIVGVLTTILNIILNYLFVNKYGIFALASSTLLSVMLNAFICATYVKIKYNINIYSLQYLIVIFSSVISVFLIINLRDVILIPYISACIILFELIFLGLLTKNDIIYIANKFRRKKR